MSMFQNLFFTLIISIFTLFLPSCTKKELSPEDCDTLSLKAYKGFPQAANKLKHRCKNVKYKYTKELCQKALENLMMSGDTGKLKERFGDRALECFTSDDLKRFKKK